MMGEIRLLNPETGKSSRVTAGNQRILRNLVTCVEKIRLRLADADLSLIRSEISQRHWDMTLLSKYQKYPAPTTWIILWQSITLPLGIQVPTASTETG